MAAKKSSIAQFMSLKDGARVATSDGLLIMKGTPELLSYGRTQKVRLRLVDAFGHNRFYLHSDIVPE